MLQSRKHSPESTERNSIDGQMVAYVTILHALLVIDVCFKPT